MIDDAWISELERRAQPLRVALPPWGEVLAREALRAPPREPAPPRGRWRIAALAIAAGAGMIWAWPREVPPRDPPATIVDGREDITVAVPIVVRPPVDVVPAPVVDPIEEALASTPEPPPPPRRPRRASRPRAAKEVAPTVDCILDPRLCHPAKAAAPPDDDLPETLGTAEIKRGLDGIKAQTRLCAAAHDGVPTQRVKVKFSIAGATGTVTMAIILEPELSAGLKHCIVKAVRGAIFPRFRKESLGVVFPLTLQ